MSAFCIPPFTASIAELRLSLHPVKRPAIPLRIPLFGCSVPAGFPSPADDHLDTLISLDETLITHPAATFLAVVRGDSMRDANLDDGDVLVVDRSLTAESGDIVVAIVDREFTVKRLCTAGGVVRLLPENSAYPAIIFQEGQELLIWGVVTSTIRRHRRGSR